MTQCSIEKRCSACHKIFPTTANYFHRNKNKKDGLQGQCKTCKSIVDAAYRLTPGRKTSLRNYGTSEKGKSAAKRYAQSPKGVLAAREKKYKNRYGMVIKEFNLMFDAQKGCCFICGIHQSKLNQRLHIDHDHETGQIRKLLCLNCNRGLGYFKDSTKSLYKAIAYLKKYKKQFKED